MYLSVKNIIEYRMKRIIFLCAILMPFLAFSQKPVIEFKATSHNFGTVSESGGNVKHTFTFKNNGQSPLILTNVRAGCGCTTPKWDRKPIVPGAVGNIEVSFNPRNRPGSFVKSITVNSNSTKPTISLTIRGNVSRKAVSPYDGFKYDFGVVKTVNKSINLGNIPHSKLVNRSISIINSGQESVAMSVTSSSPAISVSVNPVSLKKGEKGHIQLSYDPAKRNDWGFVTDQINVFENGAEKGKIQVTATISEDFSAYNNQFENAPIMTLKETEATLSDLEPDKEYTHHFYIENTGQSELIIRKIKPASSNTRLTLAKNVIKVTMTFKTGKSTKKTEMVQFTTNSPQNSIVVYRLTSTLK